jgi:hypothetical protein
MSNPIFRFSEGANPAVTLSGGRSNVSISAPEYLGIGFFEIKLGRGDGYFDGIMGTGFNTSATIITQNGERYYDFEFLRFLPDGRGLSLGVGQQVIWTSFHTRKSACEWVFT